MRLAKARPPVTAELTASSVSQSVLETKDAVNSVVTQVCSATVVKSPRVEVGCLGDEYEEYEGCSCDRVGIPHTLDQLKGYGLATEQEYSSLDFKGWRTELASAHEQQTGYRLKKT